ncbi:hypothetical protein DPMN_037391 [Dreissena polymorpha]|uniref:G-patch domain-containing protein n=1 Tax=Dreissena polymorpha TaxID=45954 RepID=A0A9D4MEF1_DREPO|nr:hypothetical protein DPMN_037391 [Dreissena polymorpha]
MLQELKEYNPICRPRPQNPICRPRPQCPYPGEINILTKFHKDWMKTVTSTVYTNKLLTDAHTHAQRTPNITRSHKLTMSLYISDEQSSFCKEGTDDDVDDDITEVLPIDREESDDDDALPVFLWKLSSHGLGDLGRWEEHTKGIGSRLLQKMGYVPGKGLGCRGEGRVEPVPIQLLPQVGKSLDRIMALKELAGDRDIFDAMKQQDRKDRKMVRKLEQQYHKLESRPDVFEFINKRLGGKKASENKRGNEDSGKGACKVETITEQKRKQVRNSFYSVLEL